MKPAGSLSLRPAALGAQRRAGAERVVQRSQVERRYDIAELDTQDREKLDKRQFAYVDRKGEGHLPVKDEAHVRNAIARWNQTEFGSARAKEAARRKILAAAKRHGIEIGEDDKILRPARGLRAATTKRGPRGGRKTVRPKRPTSRRQTAAARRNVKKARAARQGRRSR